MRKKIIILIGTAAAGFLFLTGSQSYFHYKEINFATDKCYEVGGSPVVETSFLALSYSFSCEK
ncbi:hypothetical protein [Bacillus sp. B-jedd]|uniref:hypothetical protein n=1 Tax=Bacillus sp. B-jedd TaxID=1476857 RepID=UPI0005156689|nr:hypothetical protein [Bacillus sp. B-jedd]CEG25616.1 hypothetical protein BN1002_00431 [Bacillus sp. B-jedd]